MTDPQKQEDGALKSSRARKQSQNLWYTFKSVLWAMLGVQKSSNAKRDFAQPHPWHFVIIGLVMLIAFIGLLVMVVMTVVPDTLK